MRALTARDLLQVWEWGEGRHPVDQALTILRVAFPEKTWEELTTLSLSQRDGLLLSLRMYTFGSLLQGFAHCPQCGESLEFGLETRNLPEANPMTGEQTLTLEGFEIHFRAPNMLDLAAITRQESVDAARALLVQRIVTLVRREETALPLESLPAHCIEALEAQLIARDPLLDLQLALECPACHNHWSVILDILTFFWAEITSQARRLLGEVHSLARAYGWHERDILALSDRRRKMYLQMVMA